MIFYPVSLLTILLFLWILFFFQVSCDSSWEMIWRTLIEINDETQLNSNRILKSGEDPLFFSFETETALKELYLDCLYPFECFKQGKS